MTSKKAIREIKSVAAIPKMIIKTVFGLFKFCHSILQHIIIITYGIVVIRYQIINLTESQKHFL